MIINTLIYTRFSPRPNAKECESCERQYERCAAFCEENGHFATDVFQDKDVSGAVLEREQFNNLIDQLKLLKKQKGKLLVVIDSPDRLARDLMIGLILRERIREANGLIAYADGTPTGETPEEIFIANMMLALATLERDRASYRTSRGLRRRQAKGEWFGKAPIGYERLHGKGTKLIPCDSEREAIEIARQLHKEGWTAVAIAPHLKSLVGSFRGVAWRPRTVMKMINKKHRWEEEDSEQDPTRLERNTLLAPEEG